MRAGAATVREQVGVGAASLFEGVGQDRQVVEGANVVDVASDCRDGGGEPSGFDGDGAERVAEISRSMSAWTLISMCDAVSSSSATHQAAGLHVAT